MIKNYVTLVLDRSSSMEKFRWKVPQVVKDLVRELRERSKERKQQTWFSMQTFSDYADPATPFVRIEDFNDQIVYNPNGWTALYDAVAETVERHTRDMRGSLLDDVAHLILVVTDGEENRSRRSAREVRDLMGRQTNVTFAFNVPSAQAKRNLAYSLAVPEDNINVWEQTDEGIQEMSVSTQSALGTYTLARSKGATSVSNFYATTDLSDITPTDLKQLDNQTSYFSPALVKKEQRIDEFVEQELGKHYTKGMAFYQLTKPEKIQAHKDMLLRKKGTKTIYGGPKVKDLVGIPQFKDGKVTPGNHAEYDLFVQSTSDNRKLVRGTTLLVAK